MVNESRKRILLVSPFFYPELISSGKYNTYLAQQLVAHGCDVSVITSYPLYPDWIAKLTKENIPGVKIYRAGLRVRYPRSPILRRIILELWFAFYTLRMTIKLKNTFDTVVVIFPPDIFFLFISIILPNRVNRIGIVHDIQGIMAESTKGIVRKWVGNIMSAIEKKSFTLCDRIICLSESMQNFIINTYKIPQSKCEVHYPFVTIDTYGSNTDDMAEKFPSPFLHIVYSGALGEKQKPTLLMNIFEVITDQNSNVMCHVFSGGPNFELIKKQNTRPNRILFHNLVPESQLKSLYSHSILQVIPQAEGTAAGAFPSKLPNLITSGVPVFVICDAESEITNLLHDAVGVCMVHTWDVQVISNKLQNFLLEIENIPHQKRKNLNRKLISQKFNVENLIQSILASN